MFLYSVCGPSCKLTSFKHCNNKINCGLITFPWFRHWSSGRQGESTRDIVFPWSTTISNSSSYQLYLASHGPALIHCDTLETENPFPSHSELHIWWWLSGNIKHNKELQVGGPNSNFNSNWHVHSLCHRYITLYITTTVVVIPLIKILGSKCLDRSVHCCDK